MVWLEETQKKSNRVVKRVDRLESTRSLVCPLCKGMDFEKQQGKIDSKWGVTAHKVTMMISNTDSALLFQKQNV